MHDMPEAAVTDDFKTTPFLSRPNRDTVFADRRYAQRLGYHGSTWFLPLVGRWYGALDRREAGLPRRTSK